MCSYPSVVRLSQLGQLNLSLGVSEPRYMLDRVLGKGYRIPRRLSRLSTAPCSNKFPRKSNTLTDPLKFEQKGKIGEMVHCDP